jgi:hypothetical protein
VAGKDILDTPETAYMLNTADRAVDQGVSREREARRVSIGLHMAAETFPQAETLEYAVLLKFGVCWCRKDHAVARDVQTPTRAPPMTPRSEKDPLEERFLFGMLAFRANILDLQEQGVR